MRAFFFDIDETLLDHKTWRVPSETQKALIALKAQGDLLYLNTGRSLNELQNVQQQISFCSFDGLILADGAQFLSDELQWSRYLPEPVDDLISSLEQAHINFRWESCSGIYYQHPPREEQRQLLERLFGFCPTFSRYRGDPLLRLIFYADHQTVRQLRKRFPQLRFVESGGQLVNVLAAGCGKAPAMLEVAHHMGIETEMTVAFGDGPIDRTMLLRAGLGIAMGNADAETKCCADYVTDTVGEPGIWNACLHYGFLQGEKNETYCDC